MRNILYSIVFCVVNYVLLGCNATGIESISLSAPDKNTLKVRMDVKTMGVAAVRVEYWQKKDSLQKYTTLISEPGKDHALVLTNLKPKTDYQYRVISKKDEKELISKVYDFQTSGYPMWVQDFFQVVAPDSTVVPTEFKKGFVLISRRETPGIIFLLDHKGNIRWYHQVNGTGFKTTHFTQNNTILSILGTEEYPTSYGDEILEVSLAGDTLLRLKKGQGDFKQTIHHEIILNNKNQVVTLNVNTKIMDLSGVGGSKQDTVKSDGIVVLDRQGKKVWSWSVFDELDPLKDPKILAEKKDWMHANSLNFDKDGNYIISFYNNGQIWKLDAKTGKVIWKFGKNGDFKLPAAAVFDQGHAVHFNKARDLMLFDNGTSRELTRTLIFGLDQVNKTATVKHLIALPKEFYTARMGSAYMVGDDAVLHCSSKTNSLILTNLDGRFLWAVKSRIMPYRAEFITQEQVYPFLVN